MFHERSKKAKIVSLWVLDKKAVYLQGREIGRLKSKLKDAFLRLCDSFKNHSFVNLEFSTGIERVIMT